MTMEKGKPAERKSNKGNKAVSIIGFIVICIVMVITYRPDILDPQRGKGAGGTKEPDSALPANNMVDESYSVGPEPPLLSFGPEEGEEGDDLEDHNPYEEGIESQDSEEPEGNDQALKEDKLGSSLDNYRLFLLSFNKLVENFKDDKDFSQELVIFDSIELPKELGNLLLTLKEYNNTTLLSKQDAAPEKTITPFDSKLLNKFVKITKASMLDDKQLKEKEQLLEKLPMLTGYVYSSEFQNSVLKK
ncbi:MAG: hypothetical protein Tsb006_2080 [Rickettsiaceae bacterium]